MPGDNLVPENQDQRTAEGRCLKVNSLNFDKFSLKLTNVNLSLIYLRQHINVGKILPPLLGTIRVIFFVTTIINIELL